LINSHKTISVQKEKLNTEGKCKNAAGMTAQKNKAAEMCADKGREAGAKVIQKETSADNAIIHQIRQKQRGYFIRLIRFCIQCARCAPRRGSRKKFKQT
jgi:hypothetical protein